MIAVHCSIHGRVPHLWVEQGARRSVDADGKERLLRKHDVSPPLRVLQEIAEEVVPGMESPRHQCERLHAWLPCDGTTPVPSSPLLGTMPVNGSRTRLRAVRVHARPMTSTECLDFVTIAMGDAALPRGIIAGPSLHWLSSLLRLAQTLALEGGMLPALLREQDGWHARWLPMPAARAQEERARLIRELPPSLRCLGDDSDAPPRLSATAITDALLGAWVDVLARDPLEMHDPVFPENQAVPQAGRRTRGRQAGRTAQRRKERLHDAWLNALAGQNSLIDWPDESQLKEFAERLALWRRPVELTSASPWVLAFRLHEPEPPEQDVKSEPAKRDDGRSAVTSDLYAGEENAWRLEFLARPRSDPSLHLPLSKVWRPRSRAARSLHASGPQFTEFLYAALGQAARLFTPIERGLRVTQPAAADLSAEEALDLLRFAGGFMRDAGFELLFPSWWTGRGSAKRPGVSARVHAEQSDGETFSLNTLLDFDVEATLDGERISLAELRALAKLKSPLVRMRGTWMQIDPKEVSSIVELLTERRTRRITARDALTIAFGGEQEIDGIRLTGAELHGWIDDLAQLMQGKREPEILTQPNAFNGTLRPYQQRGFSWLAFLRQWRLGSCLADDMGLGKTIQTLAMIQRDRDNGEERPVLLICPTSVVSNWKKEAARFTPELPVMIHHGSDRLREEAFSAEAVNAAIVISTYGLLHRDLSFLQQIAWAGVVLDEAQSIKNPDTRQAQSARSLKAEYRIALTGTPVENAVTDLWSIMEFLNPGLLGGRTAFRQRFQIPIQRHGDAESMARLRSVTAPFILRRMKTDRSIIADLPDKIEQKQYCTLTREQASLYEAVLEDVRETLAASEGMKRRAEILTTLLRLKQVCNHPAHFLADGSDLLHRSGKLQRLFDLLDEIRDAGERALVFSQFTEMGSLLQQALQERYAEEAFFLHGGISRKRRDTMVTQFQSDDDAPHVFLLSLKAGGTGLNLTRANHVVHFDRWWNPAVENQATDRAFRIGQKKNVQVHAFITTGTLEERIDSLMERKRDIAESVVGAGEQWITEMSDEDFMELIQLGGDAVEEGV